MRFGNLAAAITLTFVFAATAAAAPIAVVIPANSDLWLAGMPAGTNASIADVAPYQSPLLVPITIAGGDMLTFVVTGGISNGPCCAPAPPDGAGPTTHGVNGRSHRTGAENGIADVSAPINALMGLFLDDSVPNLTAAPAALDFYTLGTNFLTLSPQLKQVFFIGDGQTASGVLQEFIVPVNATRLFLGTMDGYEWANNIGYDIAIVDRLGGESAAATTSANPSPMTPVPEPTSVLLLATGLAAIAHTRSRNGRPTSSE